MQRAVLSNWCAHAAWLFNWLTVAGTVRNAVLCRSGQPGAFTRGFSDVWNIAMLGASGIGLFALGDARELWWAGAYRVFAVFVSQAAVLLKTDYYVYGLSDSDPTADRRRHLIVGLFHYAETALWFGVILRHHSWAFKSHPLSLSDSSVALYYSLVTITTLGYGDITPIHIRGAQIVSCELIVGVFLTLVVLARFVGNVGGVQQARSDQ